MHSTTRAVIIHGPGKLELGTVDVPTTGPDEVKISVAAGGICGSDLHYYLHGGFGAVRVKNPMVLGHELAGTVVETGSDVVGIVVGQRVAVNPSLPCGICENCRRGLRNHCTDMRFFGSAMRNPHIDGGFRDILVCKARQVVAIPDNLSFGEAAMAEPLAVCLHAVGEAGSLLGRRVLITGSGPIGVLTAAAARLAGAADITITDVLDAPLTIAAKLGADRMLNVAANAEALAEEIRRGGAFDIHFEATGNAQAALSGISALRVKGISVLIGQGAEIALQISSLIGKETQLRGSFRFDREFDLAVWYLSKGAIDVRPMITATLPYERAVEAFDLAADKSRSMKVQLSFAS